MSVCNEMLPENVTPVTVCGRDIYIVGTAHVSPQSVNDVRCAIATVKPDTVCVELCDARYRAMVKQRDWKSMDIFRVIKEKKAGLLLAQLVLNSFYRRIGEQLGVQPGAEMLTAIHAGEECGASLVMCDRDIVVTLKRVWASLNAWNKLKMITHVVAGLFVVEDIDESMIEEMKNKDQLEHILEAFSKGFPQVKKCLIDERDMYLSQTIRSAPGKRIVAVVGAGHVPGILQCLDRTIPLGPLTALPPRSFFPAVLKWGLPGCIAVLLVAGFFSGDVQHGVESIYIWVLVNGLLAAAGAAAACAHPLTILASFVGAPLTSLNPMIAAGWVAGLVQAWVKKPTVADIEDLPHAVATIRGFWSNPVSKILLVVVLANLGSSIGTFVSGGWIAARLF